jgi:hypothetical protein
MDNKADYKSVESRHTVGKSEMTSATAFAEQRDRDVVPAPDAASGT